MHDFVFNVETYAKVIINELNVDVSKYADRSSSNLCLRLTFSGLFKEKR